MADPFLTREGAIGIHSILSSDPNSSQANPGRNITQPRHANGSENMGSAILGTATAMTIMATLMVVARLYVRLRMTRSWGLDDYIILVALAFSMAGYGFIIPEVLSGAGRHAETLTEAQIRLSLFLNFITQPIFVWGITAVKVSLALFLMRIAPSCSYRVFLWGMVAFLLAYTSVVFVATLTQCRPLSAVWDINFKGGICFSLSTLRALNYLNSCLCLTTDILFALLPIPMVWKVQIRRRVKIVIAIILSLSIFTTAANAVRISYIARYRSTGDYLFNSSTLTIWAAIECNMGIIAASAPCTKPLFKNFFIYSLRSRPSDSNINPSPPSPSVQIPLWGDHHFTSLDSRYVFPMNPLTRFKSADEHSAGAGVIVPRISSSQRADLQPVRQRGAFDENQLLLARGHVDGGIGGMVISRSIPDDDANWMYAFAVRELSRPHILVPMRSLMVQRNSRAMESRRESLNGPTILRCCTDGGYNEKMQAKNLDVETRVFASNTEEEEMMKTEMERRKGSIPEQKEEG